MTQEALRMAHKALIGLSIKHGEMTDEGMDAITAIEKALAQEKALQALHDENERLGLYKDAYAQPEQDNTYTYASSLATTIWQKHYMKESPKWKPLDTTEGVLTQIDNMTCGLIKEKPAQPEQEPVGRFAKFTDGIWRQVTDYSAGVPLYTHPSQRTEQDGQCKRCTDGCPACDATKLQKESHDLL
jgi:hypothetical protein